MDGLLAQSLNALKSAQTPVVWLPGSPLTIRTVTVDNSIMKIAIEIYGTRGDVQPMLALAVSRIVQSTRGVEMTVDVVEKELGLRAGPEERRA
jgi:hypothetical protein